MRVTLSMILVLLTACDGTSTPDASMPEASMPDSSDVSGPIEALYDPAVLEGNAPFFDFPFPSDLRTDAAGHPNLQGLSRVRRGLAFDALSFVEAEHVGFTNQSAIYFRFSGALDTASLPADPLACAAAGSSVVLIDIDPASPERGSRMPCYARFRADATRVWPGNALVVRPVPGIPMHPGRRYAALVLDSVRGAAGQTVTASEAFASVRAGEGELGAAYADLFAALETAGIDEDHVIVASVLTTSDPAAELDRARAFVLSQPLPTLRDWTASRMSDTRVFEATFDTYELFSGSPPYSGFAEGAFRFDASGAPLDVHSQSVRIGITVPDGPEPPGGYPIILYGHGTGGDHLSHSYYEGAILAPEGLAMLGFDAPLHGIRSGGVDVTTVSDSNPVLAREIIRQSALDLALLYRMQAEGALDVPAGVDGPSAVHFARSPMLYMGHSQGAQLGGVLLGVEPGISAAFLSEGGGDALITAEEIDNSGPSIACLVAALLGEQCDDVTEDHPFMTIVVESLIDGADPLSFAHRMIRERDPSWAPLSIAMSEGMQDQYTPPRTIEALASAIGLPLIAPRLGASDALTVRNTPTLDAPVQDDLMTPAGTGVTGGLMQWNGDHFVIYSIADATNRYVQFMRGAAEGAPVIVAPR